MEKVRASNSITGDFAPELGQLGLSEAELRSGVFLGFFLFLFFFVVCVVCVGACVYV